MPDNDTKEFSSLILSSIIFGFGGLILLWSGWALTSALSTLNWDIVELARQYMLTTGMMKPLQTLVDFYSHIKGIEYLICVSFFVAFPVFFKYVNKEKRPVKVLG
jgi:hypothetical protein